jgi:hypothetical protein
LCHCCPLEDWESSLPFVLVFPCDLQEHCLYLAWFKVGSDLSVWLGEIICHRWLFEQLLVPSVHHIARVKLSLDPTMRRSGKPPHQLVYRHTSSNSIKFSLMPSCLIRFWIRCHVHQWWCTCEWLGITSHTTLMISSCLSDITQISRPKLTITLRIRRRNQPQLPLFSFSTMAITMSIVPSYFPIKNMLSVDNTL